MRAFRPLFLICLLGACRGSVDVRGLYDGAGDFVLCDRPKAVWRVSDSVLAASYRRTATRPHELLFTHLRGVRADSGSIYYSSHHFLVRQIVELRARQQGECRANAVLEALGAAPR